MTRILPFISALSGLFMLYQAQHWILLTKTEPWLCFSWGALGVILMSVAVVFRR